MKRNFLFLIGFFVIALSAAIFAACEKESKDDKSEDNSELVGNWKYIDEYQSRHNGVDYYVYITFNEDNTGTIKEKSFYGEDIYATFEYDYDSKKEILKIDIDESIDYYSVFGDSYYTGYLKYKVDWVGDNRFYLMEIYNNNDYSYYYEYNKMGPFIRQ